MTIDWQTIVVGIIVAACAAYVVRFLYREFAAKDGCGGSCGCGHEPGGNGSKHGESPSH